MCRNYTTFRNKQHQLKINSKKDFEQRTIAKKGIDKDELNKRKISCHHLIDNSVYCLITNFIANMIAIFNSDLLSNIDLSKIAQP